MSNTILECQVKQWNAHKDSVFHFQWSLDDTCIVRIHSFASIYMINY
jgi:hypothetical protein